MEVWLVLAALGGAFGWRMFSYNRLALQLQQVQAAWAEIDVELRRRLELVPVLVDLVRPHAGREVDVLDAVLAARLEVVAAEGSPGRLAAALAPFDVLVARLLALAESLPASVVSGTLRRTVADMAIAGDRIVGRRGVYNGRVADLNRRVTRFPSSLVARMADIHEAEYFRSAVRT